MESKLNSLVWAVYVAIIFTIYLLSHQQENKKEWERALIFEEFTV